MCDFYFCMETTQQTYNVATTSLQRCCNVVTLQRRCKDVVATLCVCWEPLKCIEHKRCLAGRKGNRCVILFVKKNLINKRIHFKSNHWIWCDFKDFPCVTLLCSLYQPTILLLHVIYGLEHSEMQITFLPVRIACSDGNFDSLSTSVRKYYVNLILFP